jgi:plasmid stabilization system protein ParE
MADVSFLPGAADDYSAAFGWYRERGEHVAESFEGAIDFALNQIAEAPNRFAKYDERHRCYVLRRFPYAIIYRVESEKVIVVAIAHGRRKPYYWQERNR